MKRFDKLCLLSAKSTMMPCYRDNLERESLLPQPLSVGRQRSKRLPRSPSQPRSLLHQHDRKLHQPPPSNPLLLVRKLHPSPNNSIPSSSHSSTSTTNTSTSSTITTKSLVTTSKPTITTSHHSIDHPSHRDPSTSRDRATCSGQPRNSSPNLLSS